MRFLGACLKPLNFRLVTELLQGGNLGQLLSNKARPLSLARRMRIARDIVKGMVRTLGTDSLLNRTADLYSRC